MKYFKFLISVAAVLAAPAACDHNEPEDVKTEYDDAYYASIAVVSSTSPYFTATDEGGAISFKTEGGEAVIRVECGTEWTVDNHATDLFEADWDCDSGILTVTATQNTVENELSGTMTLQTSAQKIAFATITVTQNAYGAPEITVETNEWKAPALGALTVEIGVSSSIGDYEIDVSDNWLMAEKTDSGVFLTAEENSDIVERTARVTLKSDDGIRYDTAVIAVTQDARAYVSLSAEEVKLYESGESATVSVEANFDWDFSQTGEDWFTVERSGNTLTVKITADNETANDLEGTVIITAGDGAENVSEASLRIIEYAPQPDALILIYTVTMVDPQITLPLSGTVNCTVDWGDGSIETVTKTCPAHTYGSADTYKVRINGTVTTLSSSSITSQSAPNTSLTAVEQWGNTGLKSMSYAFYYCLGLNSIPGDTSEAFSNVTDFEWAFSYCTGLSKIPSDLFVNCANVTSFTDVFCYCTALEAIPEGLFDKCPDVTNFYGTFECCVSLLSIPEEIFAKNTKAETFRAVFYNCPLLTEIPESLFVNNTEVTTFYNVFYGCSGITSIPSGLFVKNTKVTNFSYAFYNMSKVEEIPEGLFDTCTEVETFAYVFAGCSSLKTVPGNLFEKNTKVTSFEYVFQYCSSLTSVPETIFASNPNVTSFKYAFGMCSSLTEVPANLFANNPEVTSFYCTFAQSGLIKIPTGLFDNNTKVTTFFMAFDKCVDLTEVPAGLFDKCTEVTTFQALFMYCSSLKSVPTGLFDNNTKVTTFQSLFYDCESLTDVPAGLFANCPAVTSFLSSFHGCISLESLPAGLFDNNAGVTSFATAFYGCTALKSIPADLFDNTTKVTNFKQTFYGCTALTGESPYTGMTVDGETEKIHLYERTTALGFSKPTSYTGCFSGCANLTDYSAITAAGWN